LDAEMQLSLWIRRSLPLPRAALRLLPLAWLLSCAAFPVPRTAPTTEALAGPAVAPPERLVLVTIDTLRADYLGSYGKVKARTRTLDRIAEEGVRFDTVISPAPITMPAHASLMTGLDPSRHGVHTNGRFKLEDDIPTLAEQLGAAGFATAAFIGAMVLDSRYGLSRGFDVYDDQMSYRRNVRAATGAYAERTADQVVDATLAWLETAPDRFFLWVHFYDPHANYDPPRGFKPRLENPPNPMEIGLLEYAKRVFPPLYAGEIYFTDTELGRLLRVMDRRFRADGTLVVVTSDHGESLGEHGELTHSLTLYDATQKVPLLMRGPGLPGGRVIDAPVRLVDVAPTLLALAGAPPLPDTDGVDLGPWIRGERTEGLTAYVETLETHLAYGWSPVLGLRTDRYKYLRTTQPELYDLEQDRLEQRDVSGKRPEEADRLDGALTRQLAGARPVAPNVTATAAEVAMLESLGYVVRGDAGTEHSLGWVGGEDPKQAIGTFVKLLEARSRLTSGDPKGARAALEGVGEAGGWIAHARAEIAVALGDYEDAELLARDMIAAQPDHAEGYLALGAALEKLGRGADARTAYEEAARLNPNETRSFVALGRLAEAEGNYDAAVARYREALESKAPNADGALRLAALYYERGSDQEARMTLAAVDSARGAPESIVRLAEAEARAGSLESALGRLAAAMRLNPDDRELAAAHERLAGPQ
jgi:arylsulfatase A-like enzyme/Flp pilus assembly protein TadD